MSKLHKTEDYSFAKREREEFTSSRYNREYPISETQVFYTQRAYEDILKLSQEHYPNEVSAYPVGYLLTTVEKSPYRTLLASELTGLVVTHWILPPYQRNSSGHTGVEDSARETSSDLSSDLLSQLRNRRGWKLGIVGKFHTHPFYGGRFLSSGDVGSNWEGPNAQRWKLENGLEVIPMFVGWICRKEGTEKRGWRVSCFVNPPPRGNEVFACPPPKLINPDSKRIPECGYWNEETLHHVTSHINLQRKKNPPIESEEIGRGWIRLEDPNSPLFLLVNGGKEESGQREFVAEVHKRLEDSSTRFMWSGTTSLDELLSNSPFKTLGME